MTTTTTTQYTPPHHTAPLLLQQYYCDGRPLHSARPCWSVLSRGVCSSSVFFLCVRFYNLFFTAAGLFRSIFSRDVFVTVVFFFLLHLHTLSRRPTIVWSVGRPPLRNETMCAYRERRKRTSLLFLQGRSTEIRIIANRLRRRRRRLTMEVLETFFKGT